MCWNIHVQLYVLSLYLIVIFVVGERSCWPMYRREKKIFDLYGVPSRTKFKLFNFVVGHAIVIFEHAIMIFKHAIVQIEHAIMILKHAIVQTEI